MLENLSTTSKVFGGMAAFGVIGMLWGHVKFIFQKISSVLVVKAEIGSETWVMLEWYLRRHHKQSFFNTRRYSDYRTYVRPLKIFGNIIYVYLTESPTVFWIGWIPVILTGSKSNNGSSSWATISYIRKTIDIEKILEQVSIEYMKHCNNTPNTDNRFFIRHIYGSVGERMAANDKSEMQSDSPTVRGADASEDQMKRGTYRVLGFDKDDLGFTNTMDKPYITYLAFPQNVTDVINEIKRWKDSKEWYKQRGIPWKRGWLLYGKPGTGKSSLVRAIGEHLDLPVFMHDLSTMSNREFSREWSRMLSHSPCIALFEDFDSVFNGRVNVTKNQFDQALSFDCFLNVIDGIEKNEGVFTILTSNRTETLDEALGIPRSDVDSNGTMISTRPGRIDRAIELKEMDTECRMKLALRILEHCPDVIEEVVKKGDKDTGAQFQERCSQIALKRFWEDGR